MEANVGLIKMMARRHHPATMAKGTITSDVIQEGSLALLRAAETYNPQLGYRFSTYAGWWVRDRVTRCVTQQARIIRLPQYGERWCFCRRLALLGLLLFCPARGRGSVGMRKALPRADGVSDGRSTRPRAVRRGSDVHSRPISRKWWLQTMATFLALKYIHARLQFQYLGPKARSM